MSHAQAQESLPVIEPGSERSFGQRLLGAVRLDPAAWDEIAADPGALGQAAAIVVGTTLASAFASGAGSTTAAAIQGAVGTFVTWPVFAVLLWAIANWFRHPLRAGVAFRLVGFAMAPLALVALTAVPLAPLQMVVRLLALALFFAALVIGCRQALRVETMRAAFVCLMVGIVTVFLSMLLLMLSLSGS